LIEEGIAVESVKDPLAVQSVDRANHTLVVLGSSGTASSTYKVAPAVRDFVLLKAGDKVRVTVREDLAVYVLRDGQLPGPDGAPVTIATNAKVLAVDRSYRLLKLQYPDGQRETFKVGLNVRLDQMAMGDDVVVRPVEVVKLKML
jgi:hypothetical protein